MNRNNKEYLQIIHMKLNDPDSLYSTTCKQRSQSAVQRQLSANSWDVVTCKRCLAMRHKVEAKNEVRQGMN